MKLYVWTKGCARELMYRKMLATQLIDRHDIQVTWGCRSDQTYLVDDLPIEIVPIAADNNKPIDFQRLCPKGFRPLSLDPEGFEKGQTTDWRALVDSFNRRASKAGFTISVKGNLGPTVQFRYRDVVIRNDAIFVEAADEDCCDFSGLLDVQLLSETFRGLNFYFSNAIDCQAHNLFDCSHYDLIELSSISNHCNAIIGVGGAAYACSLTETNRHKMRALYYAESAHPNPWGNYQENPLHCIQNKDELLRFLAAVEKSPRVIMNTYRNNYQPKK